MLTPQEIQNKKFEKAVFGGYDMSQIDDFLDEVLADYSDLYKENAALKAKMRVLVEKIDEYRAVDEQMRKALYSAQISAEKTLEEARAEADRILENARAEADRRCGLPFPADGEPSSWADEPAQPLAAAACPQASRLHWPASESPACAPFPA